MNKTEHAIGAGVVVGTAAFLTQGSEESNPEGRLVAAMAAGGLAGALGSLPDWIEPAADGERLLRVLILVAGGAYLTHLLMDSFTGRSIPIVGRLGL